MYINRSWFVSSLKAMPSRCHSLWYCQKNHRILYSPYFHSNSDSNETAISSILVFSILPEKPRHASESPTFWLMDSLLNLLSHSCHMYCFRTDRKFVEITIKQNKKPRHILQKATVHFCKTTDMFMLYISWCRNSLYEEVKCSITLLSKHGWRWPYLSCKKKNLFGFATNMTGHIQRFP